MDPKDIVPLTQAITAETNTLVELLSRLESSDADHALWDHPPHGSELEQSQSKLLGLVQSLNKTLRGPSDYLHELVACNWEKGALYCLLEHSVLEAIPLDGEASLSTLAEKSGIYKDRLLPILRLAACEQIVEESSDKTFRHGPLSEAIVRDPGLKAFLGFQLYDTRVASAHLADSLSTPSPFWTGKSAFTHAWGQPMYGWHRTNAEKGARFAEAMKSVSKSLDPGNQLLSDWFVANHSGKCLVVDVQMQTKQTSEFLREQIPGATLTFETAQIPPNVTGFQCPTLFRDNVQIVWVIKSILWNLPDKDCIFILRNLIDFCTHEGAAQSNCVIIVNELLSPLPRTFEPHVDKAYRRRDVTVMTMHNAKLRTEKEWLDLFKEASPDIKIRGSKGYTSHSCRGQWELTCSKKEN